jgi:hypothetical protein
MTFSVIHMIGPAVSACDLVRQAGTYLPYDNTERHGNSEEETPSLGNPLIN